MIFVLIKLTQMIQLMVIVRSLLKITICWTEDSKIFILLATTSKNFNRNYGIGNELGWFDLL